MSFAKISKTGGAAGVKSLTLCARDVRSTHARDVFIRSLLRKKVSKTFSRSEKKHLSDNASL